MRLVMSLNVNGSSFAPARYTPPTPPPTTELTARDVAAATRVGLQAVPVRNNDPVTGAAKREKRGDTLDEKRAPRTPIVSTSCASWRCVATSRRSRATEPKPT